jgi:hypothetical protein
VVVQQGLKLKQHLTLSQALLAGMLCGLMLLQQQEAGAVLGVLSALSCCRSLRLHCQKRTLTGGELLLLLRLLRLLRLLQGQQWGLQQCRPCWTAAAPI